MPKNDDPTRLEPRPVAAAMGARSNPAQLKRDIEGGATGDKVRALDPGLSPLGTDDEAAGHPLDPAQLTALRQAERRNAPAVPDVSGPDRAALRRRRAFLLLALLGALLVAAALAIGN